MRCVVGGTQLALPITTVNPLRKLYSKLCRELAQSERSGVIHTRREARRLGDTPPARALRALGAHAAVSLPRFEEILAPTHTLGLLAGRRVGDLFSTLRHFLFDRLIDLERSYRGTLLGFHHGIGTVRLLREVAERRGNHAVVEFCDRWLAERVPLLDAAERELHWFADVPKKAIKSGLRISFEPAPE